MMRFTTTQKIMQLAAVLCAGAISSSVHAQQSLCGGHTVDDIVSDLDIYNSGVLGEHNMNLFDGTVFGMPIPDATAGMTMFSVNDEIGIMMSGGTMAGSAEFFIDRVPKSDALAFSGSGFAVTLEDLGLVTGCFDVSEIPQYYGTGTILTPDGKNVPATIRMLIWLGTTEAIGSNDLINHLYSVGVVRSEILNGKFFVH